MSKYVMTPGEFRKEFSSRPNYRGHVLREAETDPVRRIVIVEGMPLKTYADCVLRDVLEYSVVGAPRDTLDWLYKRLLVAGFDEEDAAGFKCVDEKQARRHLRISRFLDRENMIATTAHEDYTGPDPVRLIRSHLPQSVPRPFRIAADYLSGEQNFIEELERVNLNLIQQLSAPLVSQSSH